MIYRKNDHCPICDKERSIECYDINDRAIYFSLILDRLDKDKTTISKFDSRVLSYMKCGSCRTQFQIYWDKSGVPRPVGSNVLIDVFLRNYREDK